MTSWLLLLICWVSCAPRDAVMYLISDRSAFLWHICFLVAYIYGLWGIARDAARMLYHEYLRALRGMKSTAGALLPWLSFHGSPAC
jgi:hypothetical protein